MAKQVKASSAKNSQNLVTKHGNTAYVSIDPASVVKYVRAGNDLVIHQNNGKTIRISGFFTTDNAQKLELVFRHNGEEWPVKAVKATIPVDDEATGSEVEFVSGGKSESEVNPLLLAALAAGGIAAAASGGGGGNGGGGGKEAPPPAAPSLDTKSNPDGTVTATGVAPAGTRVTVTFPDGTSKIVTAGADGKYTATSETSQNSGQVNAVVTDNNGKTSIPAVKNYVDDVAPKSPEAISVMDEVGAVTGKIKENDLTDDARPVMSGKAEPGSTVTIYDGITKLGTANVDSAGNWTFRPATALAEGEHKITFTATDKAGNTSPATEALVFKVDTVAPPVPVLKEAVDSEGSIKGAIAASGVTDDTRPEFKGENAEAGTTIRFFDNGSEIGSTVVAADGTWSFTPEIGLQQGVHRITMLAQDTAGNKSEKSATFQFEVDTTPPSAPSITEIRDNTGQFTGNVTNGKVTDETKPVLSGSGAEAGSTVKIYDKDTLIGETTANANGTWSFTPTADLTEGEHIFTVTATDKAGNEGVASASWTINVDTTAPDVPTIKQVLNTAGEELSLDVVTNERRPTLTGEAEKGSTVTIYDNGRLISTVTAAADGTWSFELSQNLTQGEHKFTIKATDAAGNETAGTDPFTLTVDTIAPNRPEISSITDAVGDITGNLAANAMTDDPRPTLSGKAEAGSKVTIYDQGEEIGTVTADANGLWTYVPDSNLSEGLHSFTVTATDIAGNVSTSSRAFAITVDTIAPEAPEFTIGYDAVGPVVGEFANGAIINDNRPKLSGSGAEANAQVKIYQDGTLVATVRADVTGQWSWKSTTALSDGSYDFTATVTDAAGNVSQTSNAFSITIDTVPPAKPVIDDITDNVAPVEGTVIKGGFTNDTTPTLSGSGAEAHAIVRIYDGTNLLGEVTADASGLWSFTPSDALSNGQHSFAVVVVDKAGNVSPRSDAYNVTIDTLAPNAPSITAVQDDQGTIKGNVTSGKTTDATKPALSGSGAEAGSVVKIYDKGTLIGETTANTNGTWSFTPTTDLTEGEHIFTVTATDKAGNEGVPSAAWIINVDVTAPNKPTITEVQNAAGEELVLDVVTGERRPTLAGEAEKGATVTIYDNGKKIGTVIAEDDGTWSFEPKNNLAQGEHKFTITATDAAGNESVASDPFTLTVDSIAPDRPEIVAITDDVGSITGLIKANGITDDARPTLSGKAEAGSKITIYDQGEELGTVTTDTDGNWTFTPSTDLKDGPHSFTVTATDTAGNASTSSKAFAIVVDTTAPDAPRFTSGYDAVGPITGEFTDGAFINDNRPRLSGAGAEANSKVHIYQDGVLVATITADAGGQWNWRSPTALTDGAYSFTAKVEDAAGNVSAVSEAFTITVDTVAPVAPMIDSITDDQEPITGNVAQNGFTNDTTPTLKGSGAEANGTVRIYDGATLLGEVKADATGAWEYTPVNALGNGLHTFTVIGVDAAGNTSAKSAAFKITVDTLAPNAPSITQVLDDVGTVTGAVANGKTTDDTKPTLSGSGAESGSIVKIYDNGVLIGQANANANGTWSFTPTIDLTEGSHSFTVTATDAAGNESSASMPWVVVVDITPPDAKFKPEIVSATDDVLPNTGEVLNNEFTNDTTPRLNGKGAEPDGFIRIYSDGKLLGQVQADANGNWSFDVPVRPEGKHVFIAKTTDAAGNEGSSSDPFTLTIDTTAPKITDAQITSVYDDVDAYTGEVPNGGLTNDARPAISGTAAADITLVRVYDGTTLLGEVTVTGGIWSFTPESDLANGVHNFRVKAVDAAGNEGPFTTAWRVTIDTTAPNAPTITQVLDDVGSVQGAVLDGKTTDDTKPTISGSGAEGGSTVKIYANGTLIGSTIANPNGTWVFTPTTDLVEGKHVFTATSTDAAGNEGNASMPWTIEVDLTPPDAKYKPVISSATDDVLPNTGEVLNNEFTNDTTPRLNGNGAEPNGFIRIYSGGKLLGQVQADGAGNWAFDVPTLSEGKHAFIATTVDAAGNEGSSSEVFSLTVDTTAPSSTDATITSVLDDAEPIVGEVANGGITNDARPVVSGTAAADIKLVRIYDGTTLLGEVTVTDGKWSFTPDSDLANGSHTFRVKAVDAAGNEGAYSTTWRINVDTLAPNAPSITSVYDDQGTVQGNVADGKRTDDLRPTISGGGAEAGSTVKIYDNGVLIGQTIANPNGTWSFTPAADLTESTHSFTVTATDAAGNESAQSGSWRVIIDLSIPKTPEITQIWDDAQPGIGAVPKGGTTNDTTPTLSGTGAPGTILKIFVNGAYVGETTVQATGQWNYTGFVSDGSHTFTVQSVNEVGTSSAMSDPFTIIVSTAVPGTPSITSVYDDVGSITGNVGNGKSTDDVRPDIHGKADANAKVNIYDNGALIGQATADADGKWTFTPATDLTEGNHSFTAKIVDGAGVEGQPSFPVTIVVDTTAPDAPRFTSGYDAVGPITGEFTDGAFINDNRPRLSGAGAEANSKVHIYQDGVLVATITADAGGQWNWRSPTALTDGAYSFTAKVEDAAGNVSAVSEAFTITVDTVAPVAPMIDSITDDQEPITGNVAQNGFTNDTTPTLKGSGAEANGTVRIYDGATLLGEVKADATGAWEYTPVNALGNGLHTFTVIGVDAAGNTSAKSAAFKITVDTLAPNAPSITQVLDDVGTVTGAVANGKTTDDTKPTLSGSGAESGSIVKIYDNGVLIGQANANANGTWSFTPTIDLTEGSHSFTVTATDAAGNESSASMPWVVVVDITPPDAKFKPEIVSATDDVLPNTGEVLNNEFTNDTTPRLNGKGAEPDGFIRIYSDGKLLGQVQADANGNWSFDVPVRPEGKHVFIAKTTDAAGNEGSSSDPFTLTIDTTAPKITDAQITSVYDDVDAYTGEVPNGGLTNDARPAISGTAAADITLVRVYDGTTLLGEVTVTGGIWSFTPESDLANGVHNFRVKAVDAAGNEGPFTTAWRVTIDTTAPNAPTITQVLDDVGSVQGAVLDGKTTDDTKPTISGSGAEGGSTVKIYANGTLIGSTIANPNGTWVFTPTTDLVEGKHVFTATSTDAAGNEGNASMPWTIEVDLTPPDAKYKPVISSATDDVLPNTGEVLNNEFTNDTTPRLNGNGAEPNGFIRIYSGGKLLGQVQADGAGNWAFDVPTLSEGKHAFIATTVDAAGNEGSSSEVFSLTVDTTAPSSTDATITSVLDDAEPIVGEVANGGITNDARPVVSGTAAADIKLVRIYDGTTLLGEVTVTDGKWSFTPDSDLANGSHTFRVKAVDAAGNEGAYSTTWRINVDTLAPNAPSITSVYDDQGTVQGNVADGKRTDDLRPTISGGGAEAGSTVKIYDNGVLIGQTIANPNGTWSFTPAADLTESTHSFTVTATDAAGNESAQSGSWRVIIDLSIPKTPEITQIWDDAQPGIGAVPKGGTTNDTTPTLSGTGAPGTILKIFVNGAYVGETTVQATGQWNYTGFVSDGSHTFTVQSVNEVGTSSAMSDPFTIIVSTAVPGTPSITSVYDDVGSITGNVGNGKSTDDVRPDIHGKADANAKVNIYDNGALLGTATADADGKWTFTPATDLTEGNHSFTAKIVDGAGVEGQPSYPHTIIVDTTAPDAPRFTIGYDGVGPVIGEFGNGAIINDNRPKLSGAGAEPNTKVSIYQGGVLVATVTADAGGQWSWKATDALADGTYTFTAKTTDAAGNVSAASDGFKVTVDTVAPNAPMIDSITDDQEPIVGDIAKGGFTNDTTPTLKGSGAEANSIVRIYDGATMIGEVTADAAGIWSYTPVNPLSNGPHTFTVVSVDGAGNVSAKSEAFKMTVDTLAPSSPSITNVLDDVGPVQGTVANGKTTDDTKPRLSGSGAESGSIVKIYDNGVLLGQTIANPNGTWSFTPTTDLKEGAHSFTVTATDQAGNESGESIAWVVTVDLTPPTKPEITAVFDDVAPGIGNVPNGTATNDPTPTLTGKGEVGTTIRIYEGTDLLGETTVRANGTWTFTTPLQEDGLRKFTVTSVDEAGNVSAPSDSWSVVISTIPPLAPNIEYLYNNNGAENVNIPNTNVTNDQDPLLTGTAQPNLVIRIYDNGMLVGSTTADAAGKWSFNFATAGVKLSEGYHSISAAAVNELGFEGSQSFPRIVTIDITPPPPPSISSAADDVGSIINPTMQSGAITDDTLPSFRGATDPYHVIKLYRDGGILVGQAIADSTGNWVIQLTTPLDSKTHNFYATATDPAGNVSTSNSNIFTLTVDAIAPDAPVITRIVDNVPDHTGNIDKGGLTNDPAPRVEGTSEANATIKVYAGSLLVGTVRANSSGAWSLKLPEGLPDGSHVITATATDAAGNTGPASAGYTIVVDTIAPNVPTITGVIDDVPGNTGEFGNRATINDNLPEIIGRGEKGTTITIYNGGTYVGTTIVGDDGKWSFQTTRTLGDGTHKFTATATDPAGNTTVASSIFEVTIDTVAPYAPTFDTARDNVTSSDLASGGYTRDTRPTLRGKAEPNSTVEIVDAVFGVVGKVTVDTSGNWQFRVPELPNGVYNFKATATDPAGNTSVVSSGSGYRITVDTVPPVKPTIDDVADAVQGGIVGTIPSNGLTNDARPVLKGTAEAGTTLTFYGGSSGTTVLGTMTVPAGGNWTWTVPNSLSNGTNQLIVKSTDLAGNATSSTPWVILVDTTPPNAPSVSTVYDGTEPAVGNITNGGYTNETKPLFSGTAEANSTLTIMMNGQDVTKITVGADGKWTWKPDTALVDGKYDFTFKATDAAGNTSSNSSTFTVNVDTVAPTKPLITSIYDSTSPVTGEVPLDGYTNDPRARLTITGEANATVIIYDNGLQVGTVTLNSSGTATWSPTANIPEGKHTYTVKQVDRAGLESEVSDPWAITVILNPPPAPSITQVIDNKDMFTGPVENGGLTNDQRPVVSGTGVPGTTIQLYTSYNNQLLGTAVVDATGKWTITPTRDISYYSSSVQLTAKAVDLAGNISPTSSSWQLSVDTNVPSANSSTAYIQTGIPDNSDDVTLTGILKPGQMGVKVAIMRNGVVIATENVGIDGAYSIKLPRDPAGGWSKYRFVFYNQAGNVYEFDNAIMSGQSINGNYTYHRGEEVKTFYVNSDKGVTTPKIIYIVDGVGAVQGYEYVNPVTDAKDLTLSGFAKYVSPGTNTITVYLNGNAIGTTTVSSNGTWALKVNNLPEGSHVFTSTLTVGAQTSALSEAYTVTIDTTPPEAPIIDQIVSDFGIYAGIVAKNGFTNDKTLELKGTTEPFATVRIYNGSTMIGEAKADANGKWTYTTGELPDGTHIFRTLGIDKAGNMGTLNLTSPGYIVTVDTAPPAPPIINTATDAVGPYKGDVPNNSITDDKQPTLNGKAEPLSTVRIMSPDGKTILGTAVADASGNWSFKLPTALADGKYTFTAIAVDRAGNIGSASSGFAIEIDTTPPPAPVISRVQDTVPPKVGDLNTGDATNDTRPSFSGTAEANGKVKVYLNGVEIGSADVNASGVWTFRPAADKAFAEGTHNLTFKAMDKAGNLSTTETTFKVVVDVTAPAKPELNQIIDAVGIETGPVPKDGTTDDTRPTFKGKGEAGGLVTIMDNGKVLGTTTVAADGTWTFRPTDAMTAEAHTITVTVADAAGNVSVATDPWKVTVIRPAGGEINPDGDGMDGFSADTMSGGDAQSFSARSVSDEPVTDEPNDAQSHAASMSLDMSGVLAELDVQDGQDFDDSNYAANDYDDQSILAGLINLADASSDVSVPTEQSDDMTEELAGLDMTALANEVFEQPDQTESDEIDLSALPEAPAEPVAPATDTAPAAETPAVASDAYTPPSTADLELERLLQQSAAQF